jgi:tRNA threonylcarbamoyl adenosine modification protein YeaZ/ribosomal-protein-alanine acetyltransferase
MVVLALETATRAGSYAVWHDGACGGSAGDARRTHGERLPAELLDALDRQGLRLADVDLFAVVAGPGSFTGLRVGIAAIQGLAMATGRLVVPVPTLDALAGAWLGAAASPAAVLGLCLDGQRGDVFFAAREVTPAGLGDSASEPAVGTPDDAADAFDRAAGTRPLVLVGDGAQRYRQRFAERLPEARVEAERTTLAEAAAARAAADAAGGVRPHAVRPVYIRRPDAEIARDRARAATALRSLPPGWSIVRATGHDDLAGVDALQRRAFTNAWGAEAIRWELEHTDVARLYVLRDEAAGAVAYCACWMVFDELHINSLAVDEPWRRRGLARLLLQAVMRDAAASGAKSATLEVRQSNDAARALYEGLGFHVEGVRRDYYQNPREDALVLWHRRL